MRSTKAPGTFEGKMLPHLNAAFTLARWMMRNKEDAEDAVQNAYLRALRFFDDYRGGDGRAWFLQIVRNTCYTQLRSTIPQLANAEFNEEIHTNESSCGTPEAIAIRNADSEMLREVIEELPLRYREVIILRQIEGMSYCEMAKILNESLGNVRTTLFRARQQLKKRLLDRMTQRDAKLDSVAGGQKINRSSQLRSIPNVELSS